MSSRSSLREDEDIEVTERRNKLRSHPASPSKLRASRIGFLFLSFAIVMFGYGYFEDCMHFYFFIFNLTVLILRFRIDWIKAEKSGADSTYYYGLWRMRREVTSNDIVSITIVPLSKVRDFETANGGPPDFSVYKDTADACVGLGGTTLAIAILAWIVGILVIFSIGSHYVDLSCLILTLMALVFGVITVAVYEGKRPKSKVDNSAYDPQWSEFKIWTSEGLVIGSMLVFFMCSILFFLGKR